MTPMLAAALRYAELGWAVLPLYGLASGRCTCGAADCRSPGKHPHRDLVPHGVHDASRDPARITEWFARVPNANLGIATGEFVALDVDPRNGGDDTLIRLEKQHGKLPDTACQLTGGGGFHFLFILPPGTRPHSPGRGVDVKGAGGYIVAEPSTHVSGGSYAWEGSADPTEGHPIAPAPAWLYSAAPAASTPAYQQGTGYLGPQRIADLRAALAHIDPNPYAQWIAVGQALHSSEAPEAFELWDTWSQAAGNYDAALDKKWRTFNAGGSLHVESIFVWARDAGWDGTSAPVPDTRDNVLPFRAPDKNATPSQLLRLPGVLGSFVDLYNRTAPRPQPQFAVQSALAFGATVLGRRYRTTRDNWSSLYLVNVAKSAAGKEHARTVIDACLTAAGLGLLIGPSGYTSESAVFSALYHQPSHVTIIDELGDLLGNAKAQANFHKRQSITAIVQAWGLLHGTLRPQGYSTLSLQTQQRAEAAARCVQRPALTMLGMTTPKTFYDSLTEQSIEGGFLNRLLIVESHIGRQMARQADPLEVPDSLVEWCQAARGPAGPGNLAGVDLGPDQVPTPRVVDFAPDARTIFRSYEAECLASMDRLDVEGLAEMEGRSVEKALRIGLILAVSDNVAAPLVRAEHAAWAVDYVRHYTAQTIDAVREHMHGSQFAQWRQATLESIRRAGERGLTERELCRNCRPYAGLEPRMRKAVTDSLRSEDLIRWHPMGKGPSGRGKDRIAWQALQEDSDAA